MDQLKLRGIYGTYLRLNGYQISYATFLIFANTHKQTNKKTNTHALPAARDAVAIVAVVGAIAGVVGVVVTLQDSTGVVIVIVVPVVAIVTIIATVIANTWEIFFTIACTGERCYRWHISIQSAGLTLCPR